MTQLGQAIEQVFVGDSEMAMLMRLYDWSQTPLGAVETWPQSLRSALSICLNSRFPIAIYWGQDFILLYNDAWRPILGDKHDWALGHSACEVWSEIWDDIGPELAGVMATGKGTFHKDELLSMHRFGYTEECFFEYTFNPIQGEGGVVEGVFNIVTETTYRVLNDRRAQLLRAVAAKTGIAKTAKAAGGLVLGALQSDPFDIPFAQLYLIDADGKYAHLCNRIEFASDSPVSPTQIDLVAEENPNGWPIALATRAAQPQVITDLLARFGTLPGSPWAEPPQEAMVLPIAAPGHGKVSAVLVLVASPRRRLDDHYRDFFTQVAGQVAMAIANAQTYEEERKRAESLAELDRAKTTFFSNISHEFRTPLTLMLGPLQETLNRLDGQLPSDEQKQLQMVQHNGLRLLKLVNTLLDFSRIEAGRVKAIYEPTDLAAFTNDLASVFRSTIEQAGLQLMVNCESLTEPVYVDREMWEKIVLNLLSNAFKFTFSGEIVVTLRQVQSQVKLTVRDTGIGIPTAELPRLFERFHRVEGAQGRTQEGSGIGLALVQELVRLHEGQVEVASTEGVGTTFTITIPIGMAHLPAERVQPARSLAFSPFGATPYVEEALRWLPEEDTENWEYAATTVEVEQTTGSPHRSSSLPLARILLVDDNADMRSYVKRLLLSQGYKVETATDGLAALAMVQQHVPDLVLTDVMMPRLDGFGLLGQLRTAPTTREIPVILLSARAGEEARIEGLEAGADDYLTKPFSARELLARVEATLKLAQIRKQAETAIRAGEDRLKLAVEAGRMIAWEWNPFEDAIISTDLSEIYGIPNIQSAEQGFTLVHPEDQTRHQTIVENAVVNGSNYQSEFRFIRPDTGAIVWLEERGKAILNDDGSLQKLIGTTIDITVRKQAEEQLRESEKFLKAINETAPNLLYIFDLNERRNVYISPQIFPILGISSADAQELDSRILVELFHPDDLELIEQHHDRMRVAQEDEIFTIEYRMKHSSGKWLWLSSRDTIFVRDAQDKPTQILGSAIDITDRKQAEADLRQKNAVLSAVSESTSTLIYAKDREGRMLMANASLLEAVGLPESEVLGRISLEFHKPREAAEQAMENDRAVMESGQTQVFEEVVDMPTGQRTMFSVKSPYYNEAGEVIGLIGVSTDISDRVQFERDRERILQQEQEAREAAETANRIKDEFLAVLSHELRSPLNPILGWSRLLQNNKLDEARTKQALTTIERNAKLQAELIEDLLDVSRILQGKLSLTVSPVHLASTIKAAIETVRLAAEAKSIVIETKLDSDIGLVSGDVTRLQQVVWNLLSNAVKFTPTGGRVTMQLEQVDHQACITVSDTGKGIAPDFLPHVFDYFRQADSATTRKFGGLGLGLAIVRHLVELHGGTIRADSPGEGLGATFTVSFPLMQISRTVEQRPQLPQQSLTLQGIHVLVVDDETDTRDFIEFLLQQFGARVTIATSAGEALTALMRFQPDVLLSDVGMPDMDGYMLMQQVRRLSSEQGGKIPAIALTAYAGEFDQQQALSVGFQRHIPKPVEPENLVEVIVTLLDSDN